MSEQLFELQASTIIGMVHCLPLPTTAGFSGDYQKVIDQAVQDAVTLEKAGVDAVIVENGGSSSGAECSENSHWNRCSV